MLASFEIGLRLGVAADGLPLLRVGDRSAGAHQHCPARAMSGCAKPTSGLLRPFQSADRAPPPRSVAGLRRRLPANLLWRDSGRVARELDAGIFFIWRPGGSNAVPVHNVTFSIPERRLGKADVKFVVKADQQVLGTLAISNGSIVWFPRGASYGCKMEWSKFDQFMKDQAPHFEKR
jgi:hypothetical protein